MFCENCGTKLPENSKFCGICGTKVAQEPVVEQAVINEAPQEAVNEVQELPEVTENLAQEVIAEVAENPTEEVAEQPAQEQAVQTAEPPVQEAGFVVTTEAAEQEPIAQQAPIQQAYQPYQPIAPMPQVQSFEDKPKKKKPVFAIVAIAAAAIVLVGLLFGESLVNSVMKLTLNPTDYYAWVEYNNVKKFLNSSEKNMVDFTDYTTTNDLSIKISEKASDFIEDIIGEDLGLDKMTVKLENKMVVKDGKLKYAIGVDANKKNIAEAEFVYDEQEEKAYGKTELISKDYFEVDADSDDIGMALPKFDDKMQAKTFKYLRKYTKIMLDNGLEFDESKDTLTANGVSAKYTLLEADVTTKDLKKMLSAVLEELKDDDKANEFICEELIAAFGKSFGLDDDDIEELADEYEDGLDELIDMIDEIPNQDLFEYKVWVDGKGNVVAREIDVKEADAKFGYYNARSGGKQGTEIVVDIEGQKIEFKGVAKRSGNVIRKGEYVLEAMGQEILIVSVKKHNVVKIEDGEIDSEFTVKAAEDVLDLVPSEIEGILEDLSIFFDIKSDSKKGSFEIVINNEDDELLAIAVNAKVGGGSRISTPKKAEDIEDYADDLDIDDILDKLEQRLEKADIDTDFLEDIIDIPYGSPKKDASATVEPLYPDEYYDEDYDDYEYDNDDYYDEDIDEDYTYDGDSEVYTEDYSYDYY